MPMLVTLVPLRTKAPEGSMIMHAPPVNAFTNGVTRDYSNMSHCTNTACPLRPKNGGFKRIKVNKIKEKFQYFLSTPRLSDLVHARPFSRKLLCLEALFSPGRLPTLC